MRFFLDYQKTNIRNDYVNYSVTKLPEHLNTKNRKPNLSLGFRFSFHRTVHNRNDEWICPLQKAGYVKIRI